MVMEAVDASGGEHAELRRRNLGRMLRPRQIAVIGGAAAVETIRQLDHIGFTGAIWPVNPRREAMEGRACYASVADLPEGPDAAVRLAVPAVRRVDANPGVVGRLLPPERTEGDVGDPELAQAR